MEILEGNKLIAEFMGGTMMSDDTVSGYSKMNIPEWAYVKNNFDFLKIGGYEYATSWDWLMPVVEKIEKEQDMWIRIERDYVFICRFNDYSGVIAHTNTFTHKKGKIYAVWLVVVEFIKWYNANK